MIVVVVFLGGFSSGFFFYPSIFNCPFIFTQLTSESVGYSSIFNRALDI